MKTSVENKKTKTQMFQVLLLANGTSDDVGVQEADHVDFFQVKEHLKNGGSVFITSKDSQKQLYPKTKAQLHRNNSRRTYGTLFRQYSRSS
ncbi:MAG: hypothetical protein ABSF44_13000 [Candidatus Bathyarchaeia archaeon]